MPRLYLKKLHKRISHRCKLQMKSDEDLWGTFEECVGYSKRHNFTYRELFKKKYGYDYRFPNKKGE